MTKEVENLSFSITLSGVFWNKKPKYTVVLDDEIITSGEILDSKQEVIKFSKDIEEGQHFLKIRLENKTDSDTVIENGHILKDMLLNVDDIEIDDIPLGNLLWSAEYHLDEPHLYNGEKITSLSKCVNLGWNGTYELKFSSPFYIWLLENL